MSTHRVDVTTVGVISVHPNADRLELAQVGDTDWQVVVQKGLYEQGEPCIYIPIDSILEQRLEEFLFPADSKVTLSKSRVRSIKLRGALSQGMIIPMDPGLMKLFPGIYGVKMGEDVSEIIGVTKYEPPAKSVPGQMRGQQTSHNHPDFSKYTDIENWKHYPNLFDYDETLYVSEKIHGTSARYAMLPTQVNSLKKRILKLFRRLPVNEFCYGSRNVQLQLRGGKQFYPTNVYAKIARQEEIESKLQPGEVLYGEIVGDGIQKGYTYGCGDQEWKFFAYDLKVDGQYVNVAEFQVWCLDHDITPVPLIAVGKRGFLSVNDMRSGPSLVLEQGSNTPTQPVREGIVVKPMIDSTCFIGRKVLKYLNDEYLLKDQTDFH